MTSTANAAPAEKKTIEYASEVRFGVVLYGGVSLAIYISGVANEIYEMVCATPKDGRNAGATTGTREIYRRLAWLADNPILRREGTVNLLLVKVEVRNGSRIASKWS